MLKWKLMLGIIPIVGLVVGIRQILRYAFGFEGLIEFSDVSVVLSGGVFLLGFMLAGTISDYKEAEKLPGEIVAGLETVEEVMVHVAMVKGEDATPHRRSMLAVLDMIDKWLHKQATEAQLHEELNRFTARFPTIELGSHATRAFSIVSGVRRALLRIGVISRTGFLASGYAMLETMIAVCYVILVVAMFKSQLSEWVVVSFVAMIYTYMYKLIRDVDDPFDYHATGPNGAAEVELFPLAEYRARLAARIE